LNLRCGLFDSLYIYFLRGDEPPEFLFDKESSCNFDARASLKIAQTKVRKREIIERN